jgi:hypothetical protein
MPPPVDGGRGENSPSVGFSRKDVTRDETRVLSVQESGQDGSNIAHDVEIGSGTSQAQGGGLRAAPRVEIQGDGDRAGNSSGLDAGNLNLHLDLEAGQTRSSNNSTPGQTSRNSRGRGGDSWMQVSWLSASSWMAFIMNIVRRYARLLEPTYLSFRNLAVEVGARSLTIFFEHSIGLLGFFITTRALVCRRNSDRTRGEEIGPSTSSGPGF